MGSTAPPIRSSIQAVKPASQSSEPERFTSIARGAPAAAMAIWSASACSSTRSVTRRISPVRSARAMNRSGGTMPRSGWGQRSNASTEVIRPVRASSLGW